MVRKAAITGFRKRYSSETPVRTMTYRDPTIIEEAIDSGIGIRRLTISPALKERLATIINSDNLSDLKPEDFSVEWALLVGQRARISVSGIPERGVSGGVIVQFRVSPGFIEEFRDNIDREELMTAEELHALI